MVETFRWPEIESLYRSDFARFVRVAQAIVGDREAAREAVQDGFADALRSAGQWAAKGPLEAWVWRCVVNRARKARPRRTLALLAEAGVGGQDPDPDLRAYLVALPERQRLVVFLRYFADLNYREIAEALEVEVGTVSATLSAAHKSLRAAFEEATT
jgi:DNA-directed RNA polymerase specialized sigma24 family protein